MHDWAKPSHKSLKCHSGTLKKLLASESCFLFDQTDKLWQADFLKGVGQDPTSPLFLQTMSIVFVGCYIFGICWTEWHEHHEQFESIQNFLERRVEMWWRPHKTHEVGYFTYHPNFLALLLGFVEFFDCSTLVKSSKPLLHGNWYVLTNMI